MLTCERPTRNRKTSARGTTTGYAAHRRVNERPCEDCRTGHSKDVYRRRKNPTPEPEPWTDDQLYDEWLHIHQHGGDLNDWARRINVAPRVLHVALRRMGYSGEGYPIPGPGDAVVKGTIHWPEEGAIR